MTINITNTHIEGAPRENTLRILAEAAKATADAIIAITAKMDTSSNSYGIYIANVTKPEPEPADAYYDDDDLTDSERNDLEDGGMTDEEADMYAADEAEHPDDYNEPF